MPSKSKSERTACYLLTTNIHFSRAQSIARDLCCPIYKSRRSLTPGLSGIGSSRRGFCVLRKTRDGPRFPLEAHVRFLSFFLIKTFNISFCPFHLFGLGKYFNPFFIFLFRLRNFVGIGQSHNFKRTKPFK